MEKDFEKVVSFWKNRFTQFQRLQVVYLLLLILSLVVAGLISLLNQPAGYTVLIVSKISGVALVTNSVVNSFLPREEKLKTTSKRK